MVPLSSILFHTQDEDAEIISEESPRDGLEQAVPAEMLQDITLVRTIYTCSIIA